ncbi:hypothetical protein ACFGVR_02585 [Mucilaginibacter sp. AW1-3]
MKKLVLALCFICLTIFSFGQSPDPNGLCLNNYKFSEAQTMKSDFAHVFPPAANVWFDIREIKAMLDMIAAEPVVSPGGHKVDGIRIYFGKTPSQYTVMLVSTTDSSSAAQPMLHRDYFYHPKYAQYFNPLTALGINIQGESYVPTATNAYGALLHQPCTTCDCPVTPTGNYITRRRGQAMVGFLQKPPMGVGATDPKPTDSEWFPLCLFQNAVAAAKYDGIRIYYAQRPNTDPIYKLRHAFVVEPTVIDSNKKYHNEPFDCDFPVCNSAILNDFLEKYPDFKEGLKLEKNAFISQEYLKNLKEIKQKLSRSSKRADKAELDELNLFLFALTGGFDNGELCPDNCYGELIP